MELTNISNETAVSWQLDGINIDATLTRPNGNGPFPAVIMVAGSGPTDRNWNSPAHSRHQWQCSFIGTRIDRIGLRYASI